MANPFSTLVPFGADFASQYNFFESIKTIINDLDEIDPLIIESTTVPTQAQMEAAYLADAVGNVLPVPTNQSFIWMKEGIAQGEYRTIDDLFANVNDVSAGRLSTAVGMSFLMANGDILISNQTDYVGGVTTSLKKYDRRTGQLQTVVLTTDMPVGGFYASPDGTKLAFTKLDGGSKRQVYTVPYPALTPQTQLTTTTTDIRNPCWQGTKISYLESVGGNWTIKIMNDNGTSQTTVLATGVAVATNVWQMLSPDMTKVIHTKVVSSNTEVWKVNVNGTSNAKFVDPTAYSTDNPDGSALLSGDTNPMIIPNWSWDSLWVMYGRRRKNINTNISERWFNFKQSSDNNRFDDTDSYYEVHNFVAKDWYTKNLAINADLYGGNFTEEFYILVPLFSSMLYGGKGYLVSNLVYPNANVVQMYPAMMVANQADGYTSTGKIYKTSQYVPDRNDFELIRQDVAVGGETSFLISRDELKDFEHLMIVAQVATNSAAIGNGRIIFNEDGTVGNYYNNALLASTTILRAYTISATDGCGFTVSGALGTAFTEMAMTIYDIQSTDSYKTAINEISYTGSSAAFALANYFEGDILSVWKSTAAIESLRFLTSTALGAGSTISYYGIRGTPRSEKDI